MPTLTRDLPHSARYEEAIVWNDPRWAGYPFLRECTMTCRNRQRPRKNYCGRVVIGYAVLAHDAPSESFGTFNRRMWYRSDDDGTCLPYVKDGMGYDAPIEGVLPESVAPRVPSRCAAPELWERPRPVPK